LDSGALIEKKVVAQTLFEPVWIGWNEQTAGLASGWWRDEILANSAIAGVYAKSDDGKSAIQRKIIMTSLSFSCHFPPI
ncbi:LysR family transcriptional regulator, partial [Shigella flexneri]|nr:LysR family transcriptional regulator [Shigella flexneri]